MDLKRDKRQNIQKKLDFSSEPTREAHQGRREETESRQAMHEPVSGGSGQRWSRQLSSQRHPHECRRLRRLHHFRFLDRARGAEAELTLFVAQGIGRVDPGNFEGWQERGQHGR